MVFWSFYPLESQWSSHRCHSRTPAVQEYKCTPSTISYMCNVLVWWTRGQRNTAYIHSQSYSLKVQVILMIRWGSLRLVPIKSSNQLWWKLARSCTIFIFTSESIAVFSCTNPPTSHPSHRRFSHWRQVKVCLAPPTYEKLTIYLLQCWIVIKNEPSLLCLMLTMSTSNYKHAEMIAIVDAQSITLSPP